MNKLTTITAAILISIGAATAARADNPSHLRQLLSTKECAQCDLTNAGLVMSDLSGAKLTGANLVGANFNQANLTGADLRGANLTGASLNSANLTGADLRGARLNGTDLRSAYLAGANLQGIDVSTVYLQGASGIPISLGTAEDFYKWGYVEWQKNDFIAAVEHFDRSIALKPEFANAYLARSLAKFRLRDDNGAIKDAKAAERLFFSQADREGTKNAQTIIAKIELANKPTETNNVGNGNMVDLLSGLGGMLLRFF